MKKNTFLIKIYVVVIIFITSSCNTTVEDIDGFSYNVEKLGEKVWMTNNLNVTHFRNGDPIPEASSIEEWIRLGEEELPAWCKYENIEADDSIWFDGKLYNWYAINDPRGLAPKGWHIPDYDEWISLIEYLGGLSLTRQNDSPFNEWYESTNMLLEHTGGFDDAYGLFFSYEITYESGEKKIGFNGVERGFRKYDGRYLNIHNSGVWWCSTEINNDAIAIMRGKIKSSKNTIAISNSTKKNGYYVRCLKSIEK